ncbi:MAG: hypothetical protein ACREOO_02295 [bacterium]
MLRLHLYKFVKKKYKVKRDFHPADGSSRDLNIEAKWLLLLTLLKSIDLPNLAPQELQEPSTFVLFLL